MAGKANDRKPKKCAQCGKLAFDKRPINRASKRLQSPFKVPSKTGQFRHKSRSKISRDGEVASYISGLAATTGGMEIVALCKSKFGDARAPSKSAVYRFLDWLSEIPLKTDDAGQLSAIPGKCHLIPHNDT